MDINLVVSYHVQQLFSSITDTSSKAAKVTRLRMVLLWLLELFFRLPPDLAKDDGFKLEVDGSNTVVSVSSSEDSKDDTISKSSQLLDLFLL